MGTRRIRVTVCNVPTDLSRDMLAAFLNSYGKVEDVFSIITSSGLIHGDYVLKICLKRDGFQAIPDAINYKDRQLMVVVDGRRQHFWSCKQVGHLAKFCPQRSKEPNQQTAEPKLRKVWPKRHEALNPSISHPTKRKDGRHLPRKRTANQTSITTPKATTSRVDAPKETSTQETITLDPTPLSAQESREKKKQDATTEEAMDCLIPLKQRRGSDDTSTEKLCKSPIHQFSPQSTPSQKQEELSKESTPPEIPPHQKITISATTSGNSLYPIPSYTSTYISTKHSTKAPPTIYIPPLSPLLKCSSDQDLKAERKLTRQKSPTGPNLFH